MSEIDDQALDWVVKQSSGPLGEAEQRAFDLWYDQGERHQGAYLRAQAIWHTLDKTTMQANLRPTSPGRALGMTGPKPASRRAVLIGGASAAAAAGIAAWMLGPRLRTGNVLSSAAGEIRKIPLADKSVASLNSATQIEVDLTPAVRRIVLTRGEALFQVARNPERPFIVEAGNARVQAIGTAFGVNRKDGGAEVLVTEGVVEVWNSTGDHTRKRLTAGQSTFVSEQPAAIVVASAPADVERKLAWHDGRIILDNETLSDAVAEFNRYNATKLVIADPAIRDRRFVGQYRLDQPDDFADTVHALLDIPVSRTDKEIILGDKSRGI
jgi:transmembrane sensor